MNSIELSENKISTLEEGTFDDVRQEELKVELYDNEFNCDCKLQWFKQWHDTVKFFFKDIFTNLFQVLEAVLLLLQELSV